MKLTGWYKGNQKPVRIGLYERKGARRILYSWWNGRFWGLLCISPDFACRAGLDKSWNQSYPWRGIAK